MKNFCHFFLVSPFQLRVWLSTCIKVILVEFGWGPQSQYSPFINTPTIFSKIGIIILFTYGLYLLVFKSIKTKLKNRTSQGYGFSSSHVWMWELDYKESWAPKNWCFWTMMLEKTLQSPLDCKEIQPVHPKGDQSWVFIGRIDVETEIPILWPPDRKSWLISKDPDAGKDWGQEKGTTEDEMIGWHHHSGSWWWTGGPGVLQSMGSQRVGHDWATELNWKNRTSQIALGIV